MRASLLAILCLAALTPSLYADYQTSFRNGITAMDRRKWAEAASGMRSAIAENPTESSRKIFIYGTRYVEYTPHFFLGVALSNANKCGEAVTALETSEQQGVIQRTANYRELKRIVTVCAQQTPAVVRADPAPPPEVQKPAPEPASSGPQAIGVPEPVRVQPPPPATTTRTPPDTVPVVTAPVTLEPALVAARQKLEAALSDSRNLLDGAKPPARATASHDALRRAVAAATAARNSDSTQKVQSATRTLSEASAALRRALATVPGGAGAQLAEAVRAYIRGDYQTTAALLDRARFESKGERAQAALFRAAARYAMYTLEGSRNDGLRTQAIADLREYRRIDTTQPDVRLFPPPFRRLWAETR